jgi:hypothetical protein
MISPDEVGASVSPTTGTGAIDAGVSVHFGLYRSGIDHHDGYEVLVRVMHKNDRFDLAIKATNFPLSLTHGTSCRP